MLDIVSGMWYCSMISGYAGIKIDKKKYDVHRVIADATELGFDMVVHHIDGDRRNNDPSNLVVMSRADHCRLHGFGTSVRSTPIFRPSESNTAVCRKCNRELPWNQFKSDRNCSHGKKSICKECYNKYRREWRALQKTKTNIWPLAFTIGGADELSVSSVQTVLL